MTACCFVLSIYDVQLISTNQSAEMDALRAQVVRLQAEKNDLVALNSELQLKADQNSQDDGSFIEIIRVSVQHNTLLNDTSPVTGGFMFSSLSPSGR